MGGDFLRYVAGVAIWQLSRKFYTQFREIAAEMRRCADTTALMSGLANHGVLRVGLSRAVPNVVAPGKRNPLDVHTKIV